VRWIPDNVNLQLVPPCRAWKRDGKLTLLWSGEAVKLFELLRIGDVLRSYASHIRLVLVTNDLSAMDRWFEPWKQRLESLLAEIEHEIVPFRSVKELLEVYNRGGVFISPRYLDNTYNWGHTEWKIALPMVCGRVALASPLPRRNVPRALACGFAKTTTRGRPHSMPCCLTASISKARERRRGK
jgi:hypothetical protein